jgi:hypothetical protein
MGRKLGSRSLGVLLLGVAPGLVGAGERPPPLIPPVDSTGEPPSASKADRPIATPYPGGSMLVIPGVNSPAAGRPRRATPAGPESTDSEAPPLDTGPELIGPAGPGPRITPSNDVPPPRPARARNPLPRDVVSSTPSRGALTAREDAPGRDARGAREATPKAATPPAARRPTGWFGRFVPIPPAGGRDDAGRSAIRVEPSTDPAAEAALKRRIERQIRESLGDRVSDVDVRIVGRKVAIRARGTRFWQRRTVRRTLESLPGLAGYQASVELLD